jgi:hypothetical protein
MGKLLLILLLMLAGFLALAIWLYNTFGIWGFVGALALFAVMVYALKFLVVWGFKRIFLAPFKAKGAVLNNAELVIHSIAVAQAPPRSAYEDDEVDEGFEDEEEDEEGEVRSITLSNTNGDDFDEEQADEDEADYDDEVPQDWYFVDVTITPRPPEGAFRLWEPGELVLVNPEDQGDDINSDDLGHVADIEVWQDGKWKPDEGFKYEGQQRLKMRIGLEPGTRRARFKYYFEIFGDTVEFPAPIDV